MKNLFLAAMACSLMAVSAPAFAQQAGESMQSGPYISAAEAASHRGGMRMRMERWRRHHRWHHHHHRTH